MRKNKKQKENEQKKAEQKKTEQKKDEQTEQTESEKAVSTRRMVHGELEMLVVNEWDSFLTGYPDRFAQKLKNVLILRGIKPAVFCKLAEIKEDEFAELVKGEFLPDFVTFLRMLYVLEPNSKLLLKHDSADDPTFF